MESTRESQRGSLRIGKLSRFKADLTISLRALPSGSQLKGIRHQLEQCVKYLALG